MENVIPFDASLFHFLRPHALWALLGLMPLAVWVWQSRFSAGAWQTWVDPQLQPHVLTHGSKQTNGFKRAWLLLVWLLAVVALAGPTWQQRPTPLLRSDLARIVVLDLSRSMLATDLRPSRLQLARLKVQDLLQQSRDSKAGLLVFAAQAFPIAPLTDDIQTLLAQVPSLHPDLMPAQGGRIDRALLQALEMLNNGAAGAGGQVLLVTDSRPQEAAFAAAQSLRDRGYELSVLAVGTEQGAPIPEDRRRGRGFVKDKSGNIVISGLPLDDLQRLAEAGGGQLSLLTADDSDIKKLNKVLSSDDAANEQENGRAKSGDQWLEAGPYLLLLLLPLAALGFRRGWLMLLLCAMNLPITTDSYAAEKAAAAPVSTSSLWLNADQLGKKALAAGDAEAAQQLFESTDWSAVAQYRGGQYKQAAEYWAAQQQAAASFNQGNALAQAGELQSAIAAWQQVPPEHELFAAAAENIEIIKPLLEQQQQEQEQQEQQEQQQDNKQEESDSEQSEQDKQSDAPPEEQQGGQESESESESESDSSQQQQAEQQSNESEGSESEAAEQQDQQDAEAKQQNAQEGKEPELSEAEKAQAMAAQEASEQAQEQVIDQWLNRVPDDPGGLLREKFKRDYQRRMQQRGSQYQDEEQAW